MADELVPFAGHVRLPSPASLKETLRQALDGYATHEREARGPVTQQEDVYALVRRLSAAHEAFTEYAHAFSTAAATAVKEMQAELLFAVGEQDGVPTSGLTVPDADGVEVRFTLSQPTSHEIDADQVISTAIMDTILRFRDTEPDELPGDDYDEYRDRYERWMADVMRTAIDRVLALGSYSMQVSKVKAFSAELASTGADDDSAVVRGSVTSVKRYGGIKVERRRRGKP